MRKILFTILIIILTVGSVSAKTKVVTSSSDLAAIAKEIGGDLIEVKSIASGKNNLHYIEILPSYMLKVSKADIYLKIGLSHDYWADNIIDGARNNDLLIVDCSNGVDVLEKPTGKIDASMGDIHAEGNPHYWLNPDNGHVIAENIYEALIKSDPDNQSDYQDNYNSFNKKLDSAISVWQTQSTTIPHREIVTYHNSWPYFARAFNLNIVGFIEPKPGIEPTASHSAELIKLIKQRKVTLIFKEPYFSARAPQSISEATGARVVTVPSSVGGVDGVKTYFDLFDKLLQLLKGAKS